MRSSPLYITPQLAEGWDEDAKVALLQAKYVLKNLNTERPGCGYGKLADVCEQVALRREAPAPAEGVKVDAPFYGAQCPSYPACSGGCGLGCTHDVLEAKALATRPDTAEARAREVVNAMVLSTHSISFKADLDAIDQALSTGDEATKSEGGHESRGAAVSCEIPAQRSGESRDPLGDGSVAATSRPHLAALAWFMFQTGARISEALRVTWDDVNIEARTVRIGQRKTKG